MGQRFDKYLGAAAGVAIALLVADIALTLRNTRRLHEDAFWVAHTHQVRAGLETILSLAADAETGQRGYIMTGEADYLAPYNAAVSAIQHQVDDVERLTADNPRQQERIPELRARLAAKLQELDATIALRRNQGFDAALGGVRTGGGRTEMDALRAVIGEMIRDEQQLLAERSERSDQTYRVAVFTSLLAGVTAVAGVGAFAYLLRRYLVTRAKAAALITEQAERLRTTLASIGDAVITTDTEGRVTNMNPVAESLTGWTSAAAAGQSLDTVFHIVNEETRELVENPATRALREGVVVGLANHTVLIAKDGAERPIDDSAAPIQSKAGEILGCVLVFRDVAVRRQVELRLRESEEQYRSLVEQIKEHAIFRMDVQGRASTWNEGVRHVLGFEDTEFIGQDITPLIFTPEDVASGVPHQELATAAAQNTASDDRWMQKKDGTRFWAAGITNALRDDQGNLIGFSKVMRDQTEQKRMEDQLRRLAAELSEAGHRKDEFLAMLAHELRNPLAPLRKGLQILRLSNHGGDSLQKTGDMMERQLSQMVRLVDDLLDVSRISRGKLELRTEVVELQAVVKNALETSRPNIDAGGHRLTVRLPDEPIYVDADVVRLSQVFANLLTNAAKYSEPEGQIELSAEQQDGQVVVRVRDAGIGIPADMLPKIFDMFMQVDRSLEKSQGGLGIGLTLVRRLVEMHGGSVEARSDGHGQGSEFVVSLPVASPGSSPAGLSSSQARQPSRPERRRILVADDSADAAASLVMMLEIMGHEVHTANDGVEAVEAAERLCPDLVLLDIGMPRLNGYEACRRIREQPWGRAMVLAALTGWGQEEDRRRSQEAGFHHHLVKPVALAVLEKVLAGLPA